MRVSGCDSPPASFVPHRNTRMTPRHLVPLCSVLATILSSPFALGQTLVGEAVQVDSTRGPEPCNETTISAASSNPLEIVAGWNDYREGSPRTGIGLSLDGGETWTDSLLRPAAPYRALTEGDPMTTGDDRTGTLWAGGISFAGNGGVFVARKEPGAPVFGDPVMARVTGGADKGWMAAGPDPATPDQTRVYIAYNEGLLSSADMGDTWDGPVSLGSGLGFLPRVGPAGELYVAYWDFFDRVELLRSFDGGLSFDPPLLIAQRMDVWGIDGSRVPGDYRVASLQGLAVDPRDGTLYAVYPDTTDLTSGNFNVDVYFTKSFDRGNTWTVPVILNADALPTGDQFFPWIEIDRSGRLHVTFYDTRNSAQSDNAPQALIDAYYAFSDDGGLSWTERRLTPSAFDTGQDGFGGAFIGDYIGLSNAGKRTIPCYMSTAPNASADIFVNVIKDGVAQEYCMGLECPCGNDDPHAGCGNFGTDGLMSTGGRLGASGSSSIDSDGLVIEATGLAPSALALILTSQARRNLPLGDGRRCFGGPFFRFPARMANGAGNLAFGPGEVVQHVSTKLGPPAQILPGSTWHYQIWYRDSNGPCGSNFNTTNAISVDWQP